MHVLSKKVEKKPFAGETFMKEYNVYYIDEFQYFDFVMLAFEVEIFYETLFSRPV